MQPARSEWRLRVLSWGAETPDSSNTEDFDSVSLKEKINCHVIICLKKDSNLGSCVLALASHHPIFLIINS